MKTIVVSAVNLRKGGTLTILRDCLEAFAAYRREHDIRVVALVHKKELAYYDGIEYIELPWSIKSWAHRLWCEYMTMHQISKQLGDIHLWLSLHDTTPRIKARHQAVYCHNSYPFFRWKWRHLLQNYRIVCFAMFTKWIYRINIHRNDFIIVQQQWFRKAFQEMFGIKKEKIIVASPDTSLVDLPSALPVRKEGTPFRIIYPAFPDVHKNFECLCEAARLLEDEVGEDRFQVLLTTDRDFNKYTRWIDKKWGHVKSIRFCGFMDRQHLYEQYAQADCLVFPSKVETWGLPISEFSVTGRPMLLADLPYAHETAAGSLKTTFFNPEDAMQLKTLIKYTMDGEENHLHAAEETQQEPPCATNWQQLISLILES